MSTRTDVIEGLHSTIFDKTIIPVVMEMLRIFPDSIVIASGLYALITLSYPYGVFFGSMLEATLLFRGINWFAKYTGAVGTNLTNSDMYSDRCRTGFSNPGSSISGLSMFQDSSISYPFPSAPIYMLTTAAAYVFTTLNYQSKELEALGPAYASRYYVSATLLIIFIGIFMTFRYLFGCDPFGIMLLTIPIGLVVGFLLVRQNVGLLGPTSINLLGIPLLRNRTADGKKLYVCPK
jgi:hypothetical protein